MLQALGSGDVTVTLSWSGAPDVDLYVTSPLGETIYYQNKSSASGGQLDRDDTDGGGPENIFWPSGKAPKGTYVVRVQLYKGDSASYKTTLIINGKRKTYSGSLQGEKASQEVTRFEAK